LLERLGFQWNPGVIAAGVVAYRATSPIYLTPFPDTAPTLLKLRDAGYKLGVASKERAVKQWQKPIQIGLTHLFHAVTISEETRSEALATETLLKTLEKLGSVEPEKAIFLACDLAHEIAIENNANIVTIRMRTGTNRASTPKKPDEKPFFEIDELSDLFDVLQLKT
jgi:putative hydrolase of the HAD superfamily